MHAQLTQVNDDDEYLLFILGLVSFSRDLLATLEREKSPASKAPSEPRGQETGSLLV